MKKTICLLLLLLTASAFAQGVRFILGNKDVTGTTVSEKIVVDDMILTRFTLYNSTGKDKAFFLTRLLDTKLATNYSVFYVVNCTCFGPVEDSVYTLPDTIKIKSHDSLSPYDGGCVGLDAYISVWEKCEPHRITYIIWDSVSTDSTKLIMEYTCPNDIEERAAGSVSAPYPNPASTYVAFDYQLNGMQRRAKIQLYDVMGRPVREVALEHTVGSVQLEVSELPVGFYSYALLINDQRAGNGKIIIQSP
jgi:hypothetical protein